MKPHSFLSVLLASSGLVALCSSCSHDSHDHEPKAQASEPEPVRHLRFGKQPMPDLEHPSLVKSQPARFLAHFSVLASGEPVREGRVQILLGEQRMETDKPVRDGLFIPEGAAAVSGWQKLQVVLENVTLREAFDLGIVEVHENERLVPAAQPGSPADAVGSGFKQQWSVGLLVQPAGEGGVRLRQEFPGVLEFDDNANATVSAGVGGLLAAIEGQRLPSAGERVEQGSQLGWIDPLLSGSDAAQLRVWECASGNSRPGCSSRNPRMSWSWRACSLRWRSGSWPAQPALASAGWLFPSGVGRSQWKLDLLQPLADAWLRAPRRERARVDQEQALLDLSVSARLALSREQQALGLISAQAVAQDVLAHATRMFESEQTQTQAREASRAHAACLFWEGSLEAVPLAIAPRQEALESDASTLLARAELSQRDLRQTALNIEGAKADLELAKQGCWTGLEVGLSAERLAEAGSTVLGPAATLELPLNGSQAAAVAAAEQRLMQQQALREERLAQARQELLALLSQLQETETNRQRMESQLLAALDRQRETAQAALATGDTTREVLIEIESARLDLLRELEALRWSAIELRMKLEEASGEALLSSGRATAPEPVPPGP